MRAGNLPDVAQVGVTEVNLTSRVTPRAGKGSPVIPEFPLPGPARETQRLPANNPGPGLLDLAGGMAGTCSFG